MAQYFNLTLDMTAPTDGAIGVLNYYKDNSTPITLSVNGARFMKVWIDQTAEGDAEDAPAAWLPYSTNWTPNFTVEGSNYIHAIFMDEVNNVSDVVNSQATIFDKTAPTITSVVINDGAETTTNRNVIVKVSFNDVVSGTSKIYISGDLDPTSETEFIVSDAERTQGFKNCAVILKDITNPSHRAIETVNARAEDRAGNIGEVKLGTIVVYTGGIDPLIVLKNEDGALLSEHYNKQPFKLELQILTGTSDLIDGYAVWGDFNDDGGVTPTLEPSTFTDWPEEVTTVTLNKKFTLVDGNKVVNGKVLLNVSEIAGTVATHAELPSTANDGDIYLVTVDETHSGQKDYYRFDSTSEAFAYYGIYNDDVSAISYLSEATVHYSTAEPSIVLTGDVTVISDKEEHNEVVLTGTFTTACDISEYKVVAYASEAAAQAGTYADVTNVDLYGTDPIETGEIWSPTLTENKLVLAVPNEGNKYLVMYAKNLCDNKGKSNILIINVDLTGPTGTIATNQYYREVSGFTSSAIDSGSSVSKMVAWIDSSSSTEIVPVTATEVDYHANLTAAEVDWTGVAQGTVYVHAKWTDLVGNIGYTHKSFVYDDVSPTGCAITGPTSTNTPNVTVQLTAGDITSGMGYYKIFGDIVGSSTAEYQPFAEAVNIVLTDGDGDKVVKCLFKDNAGNEIAEAVQCTIKLITDGGTATIALYKADDSEITGDFTNVVSLRGHISCVDTTKVGEVVQYKIWGNITEASTEATATWKAFTLETGQTYMSVPFNLTSGDGLKTISVKLKDEGGNESGIGSAVITLDTTIPIVNISEQDYDIISKVHEPRLTNSGETITNSYSDKMTFTFNCDSKILEWKVCVNNSGQQASSAVAIGTEGGSINMTGGTKPANTPVNCVIMGADFAEAVEDEDGLYEVIVYCKDEAGNWSAIHAI